MYSAMKLFRRIVETGSFAQASRDFDITPSSATRQLLSLEKELGAQLLTRTTRKLTMTEAGELYFERVVGILDEIDEANRAVGQLLRVPRGTLRINSTVTFGQMYIAPHLPEFMRCYPDIRLEFYMTDKVVDLVEERVDIAIRIGELKDSSLVSRKLMPHRYILCAAPDYLRRHSTPSTPEELQQHSCLTFAFSPGSDKWYFGPEGNREEFTVRGILRVNSVEVLRNMIVAGMGVGVLTDWILREDLINGRVVELLPDWNVAPLPVTNSAIHVVYPANRRKAPNVRAFIDFLTAKLPH